MENYNQQQYDKAKKKVQEIKGFYIHLTVFILVNLFLILIQSGLLRGNFQFSTSFLGYLTTPFFWGIGLAFHALHVFKDKISLFKDWEQKKIKEYMDKEEQDFNNTFK